MSKAKVTKIQRVYLAAGWRPARDGSKHVLLVCPCGKHRAVLHRGYQPIYAERVARRATEACSA